MALDVKQYFATPEEVIARKDTLYSQSMHFAKELEYFSSFLQKKNKNQNIRPDNYDREGINSMLDFIHQAKEGFEFDHKTANESQQMSWGLIYGKAYNKIKLLAKNPADKKNVSEVIHDISNLILNVSDMKIIPDDKLDFYITMMSAFEKLVNPDSNWYSKSTIVD
jgi:hypothetical protein